MKTTHEYFHNNLIDMLETNQHGYTREENLLYDEGLEVVFFDSEEEMKEEQKELQEYMQRKRYEIKETLKTINERIAVILI